MVLNTGNNKLFQEILEKYISGDSIAKKYLASILKKKNHLKGHQSQDMKIIQFDSILSK